MAKRISSACSLSDFCTVKPTVIALTVCHAQVRVFKLCALSLNRTDCVRDNPFGWYIQLGTHDDEVCDRDQCSQSDEPADDIPNNDRRKI